MIGRVVVTIAEREDSLRVHVRHEAPDGLWDSKDKALSGVSYVASLEEAISGVPEQIRAVLQASRERGAS